MIPLRRNLLRAVLSIGTKRKEREASVGFPILINPDLNWTEFI